MNEAVAALRNARPSPTGYARLGGGAPTAQNDPDEVAALAAAVRPGTAVVPLSMIDPARLSPAGLADAAVAWSRVQGWAAAQRYRVLAEFDGPLPERVRTALGLSATSVEHEVRTARDLALRQPEVLRALGRGELTDARARQLADSAPHVDRELAG